MLRALVSSSPANETEAPPAVAARPSAPAAAPPRLSPIRAVLADAADGVRRSAEVIREAPLERPKAGGLAQVGYGFALPLAAMRAVLRDPLARRRYLLASWVRAGVVLAAALPIALKLSESAKALEPAADLLTAIARLVALLSSLYAALAVVEWIVIALTHEYDDQTARRAALLIGAPPEDEPRAPRVRLDLPWVGKRIKRAIRGYRVYLVGLPAISILWLFPLVGAALYAAAVAGWTFYWFAVQTVAKTAAAWTDEGRAPPPWFLRLWGAATERAPGFRWSLPRSYGRFWWRHAEAMFSPCKAVEDAPHTFLGLALLRALLGVPGVYLFFRPFFPVAVAYIITASRRGEGADALAAGAGTLAPGAEAPRGDAR